MHLISRKHILVVCLSCYVRLCTNQWVWSTLVVNMAVMKPERCA